jgi:hypothetical protein
MTRFNLVLFIEYKVIKILYIAHKHKISPYSTKSRNSLYSISICMFLLQFPTLCFTKKNKHYSLLSVLC